MVSFSLQFRSAKAEDPAKKMLLKRFYDELFSVSDSGMFEKNERAVFIAGGRIIRLDEHRQTSVFSLAMRP